MTRRDDRGRFVAERTTTETTHTVTERITIHPPDHDRPAPLAEAWARLTAPLDTSPPVIITPAARAEWFHLADAQRNAAQQDWDDVDDWTWEAQENSDRLAALGLSMAGYHGWAQASQLEAITGRSA